MSKRYSTAALVLIVAAAMAFAQTSPVTVTGFLTDTSCGKRGATSLHIDCPKRKVAAGTAKYAIYEQASRRLYVLACAALVMHNMARKFVDEVKGHDLEQIHWIGR